MRNLDFDANRDAVFVADLYNSPLQAWFLPTLVTQCWMFMEVPTSLHLNQAISLLLPLLSLLVLVAGRAVSHLFGSHLGK